MIVFYLIVAFGSTPGGTQVRLVTVGLCSILLFPCAINETKISFVFLPVFVGLLTLTSKVYRVIPFVILGVALFYGLNTLYTEYEQESSNIFDWKYLEKYLLYDQRTDVDVPRFQKLNMSLAFMSGDIPTFAIGMGYGVFMGGGMLGESRLYQVIFYLRGARMFLNTVFFQGGILAVACLALAVFWFVRSRSIQSPNMRRLKWFLAFVLFAMWFYHDSLLNRAYAIIVSYLILWTEMGGIDMEKEIDVSDEERDRASGVEGFTREVEQ
jgi:hypothetical protein